MPEHRVYTTEFSKVYPLYVQKAERKNRTKDEVDQTVRDQACLLHISSFKRKLQHWRGIPGILCP